MKQNTQYSARRRRNPRSADSLVRECSNDQRGTRTRLFAFLPATTLLLLITMGFGTQAESAQAPNTSREKSLALSRGHALKIDGTLWKLNYSSTNNRADPIRIGGCNWQAVAASEDHTLALEADGSLWAWGDNSYGQLGARTSEYRFEPTRVGTDTNWAAVATGWGHTLGLKSDGSLWAWGFNSWGQLGDGTTEWRNTPAKIGKDDDWVAIDGDYGISVGLKGDGSFWAWGLLQEPVLSPTRFGNNTDWTALDAGLLNGFAGRSHSMLLNADGSIWAFSGTAFNRVDPGNDWVEIDSSGACGEHSCRTLDMGIKNDGSLWYRHSSGSFAQIGTDTGWVAVRGSPNSPSDCFCEPPPPGFSWVGLKSDGSLWLGQATGQWFGHVPGWTVNQFEVRRINNDIDWGAPQSMP